MKHGAEEVEVLDEVVEVEVVKVEAEVEGETGVEEEVEDAVENEWDVQDPVGFWDPAGLPPNGSMEIFARRRQAELQHGRGSMVATRGYITPEFIGKLPGTLSPSEGFGVEALGRQQGPR